MKVSKRDMNYINKALKISLRSSMLMKHGCVVTSSGKYIAEGYNTYRNRFGDEFYDSSDKICSCHAEMDALRNAFKKKSRNNLIKGYQCFESL